MICVSFEMQPTAASNLPPIVQRLLALNEVLAKRTTLPFILRRLLMLDCVQSVYTELVEVRDLILRRSIFHRKQISLSL
jgi:hypothetical protein